MKKAISSYFLTKKSYLIMQNYSTQHLYVFLAIFITIIFPHISFGADFNQSESLLPEGLVMADRFEPGIGAHVGKILLVDGEAVIIHSGSKTGFRAAKDMPLYKGDTVVTLAKAKLRLSFNDGSIITMSSETKLAVNRSDYNEANKSRSTFLGMETGKASFWAVKMKEFKHSEFNVKTKTAVAGVRGSDFVLSASIIMTEATTLKDTSLELASLDFPEEEPLLLSDYEHSSVAKGAMPTEAEKVDIAEVEQMMKEFLFEGERFNPDTMIEKAEEKRGEKEGETAAETKGQETAKAQESIYTKIEDAGVLLRPDNLARFDDIQTLKDIQVYKASDFFQKEEFSALKDNVNNQQTDMYNEKHESATMDLQTLPAPVDVP